MDNMSSLLIQFKKKWSVWIANQCKLNHNYYYEKFKTVEKLYFLCTVYPKNTQKNKNLVLLFYKNSKIKPISSLNKVLPSFSKLSPTPES